MSKLYKSLIALIITVGLFMPLTTPIQATRNLQTAPTPPAGQLGSITVIRTTAEVPIITPDDQFISGVPIRVTQVKLAEDAIPSMINLANPEWVIENIDIIGEAIYRVTDESGEAKFENLPQGIWLVQELDTAEINGETITNPVDIDQQFADFIVGLPRWIEDGNQQAGGRWEFDVRVYPKSEIPDDGAYKEAIYYSSNVATWELGHIIPLEVHLLSHFFVTDFIPSGLEFIKGTVEARFETSTSDSGWHEATGQLTYGTHFTVTASEHNSQTGQRVRIEITDTGREYLAESGLVGTGRIIFRLDTEILYGGRHTNDSEWEVGRPCPICPDKPCDDKNDTINTFYLEILKLSTSNQPLNAAHFRVYRELTNSESNLEDEKWADFARENNVYDRGRNEEPRFVIPLQNREGNIISGSTNRNGILRFPTPMSTEGANAPRIWIRETTAPTGYRIINEWIPVNINSNYADGTTVRITVFNEPLTGDGGNRLPQTGVIVTTLTGAGVILVTTALIIAQKKRKTDTQI